MNTKDAAKRIKSLMDFYNLTASSFAERINVQRSSISHILSGRNNPSLDFMYKVIDSFPEINPMWLIAGKGSMRQLEMFEREEISESHHEPIQKTANGETFNEAESDFFEQSLKSRENVRAYNQRRKTSKTERFAMQTSLPFLEDKSEKQIEKIMIFYTDKTFACYHPE